MATAMSATPVSSTLEKSMAKKIPMMVKPYIINWVRESEMVVLMLSTSLVRRLISSPCCLASKKERGSSFIFPNRLVRIW